MLLLCYFPDFHKSTSKTGHYIEFKPLYRNHVTLNKIKMTKKNKEKIFSGI